MLSAWSRAFVFVAIVALLGSAHCLGNCALEAYRSTKAPSNSCHHKESHNPDSAPCSHQHSEFAAPEAGIAKVKAATAAAAIPVPSDFVATILPEPVFLSHPAIGSPPGRLFRLTASVLRI